MSNPDWLDVTNAILLLRSVSTLLGEPRIENLLIHDEQLRNEVTNAANICCLALHVIGLKVKVEAASPPPYHPNPWGDPKNQPNEP
jgi:hypothetical protein